MELPTDKYETDTGRSAGGAAIATPAQMDFFTHVDVLDVGGALDKLPELPGPAPSAAGQGAGKARPGDAATGQGTGHGTLRAAGPRIAAETVPAKPAEGKVRRA